MKRFITIFVLLALMVVPVMAGVFDGVGSWLEDNWKALSGVVAVLVGGYAVPVVRIFAREILVASIKALISREMLKLMFLKLAHDYVESTETDLDNKWLERVEKNLS